MSTRLPQTRKTDEAGFTLVELLVVIVILGILAAVVVFAVGGIKDKGQGSACEIDKRTLATAEEAYFAQPGSAGGRYVAQDGTDQPTDLVPDYASKPPTYHIVTVSQDDPATANINEAGRSYAIAPATTGPGAGKCTS